MGLNIKNREVEDLARQIAQATGETKTEAIRKALLDRRDRLALPPLSEKLRRWEEAMRSLHGGRTFAPVTKQEIDALYE